jgi:hypothetical protein
MNLETIRHRLDFERRTLARDGQTIEILPQLTRSRSDDGSRYAVEFSTFSAADADAAVAAQVAHYRALGVEVEWKLFRHDQPADLMDRLARHGFEIGPCETVVVLNLKDRPAWIDDPPPHPVTPVQDFSQLDIYRRVEQEVFPESGQYAFNQLSRDIHAGSTRQIGYVAFVDGCPASIGRLETDPESLFGGLYGGGTVERFRGRGLYRAIVAARARQAINLGIRYLIVDALPTSRPILEKLGFIRLTETWPCVLRRATPGPANQVVRRAPLSSE